MNSSDEQHVLDELVLMAYQPHPQLTTNYINAILMLLCYVVILIPLLILYPHQRGVSVFPTIRARAAGGSLLRPPPMSFVGREEWMKQRDEVLRTYLLVLRGMASAGKRLVPEEVEKVVVVASIQHFEAALVRMVVVEPSSAEELERAGGDRAIAAAFRASTTPY